ncbi:MAG: FmdB family zinc ribbon protein [Chloroflexota bacterium]|jgi:putative FmdB family regulatory protein
MPLYEYLCQDCSTKFEKLVPASRSHEQPPCPKCSGGNTRKLLSTFASVRERSDFGSVAPVSSGGGCAGCSGGSCSTCGR